MPEVIKKKSRFSRLLQNIGTGLSSKAGQARDLRQPLPSSRKVRRVSARLHGAISPVKLSTQIKRKRRKRTGRRAGRPSGTYKYYDPDTGKPIDVFTYRKLMSRKRAMERLRRPQEFERTKPYQPSPPQAAQTQPRLLQQPDNILRPVGGNILQAPSFMKGELRDTGKNTPLINVDAMNRPVTNPHGDYYIEVDPASGKQMVRRRVSERWLN